MADNISIIAELMLNKPNGKEFEPIGSIFGTGLDMVSSVSVKIGLLRTVEVDVVLNPDLETGLKILRSKRIGLGFTAKVNSVGGQSSFLDGIATPTLTDMHLNMMAVRIGCGGTLSPWYKCLLLQPEISISDTDISLTLKGIGILFNQESEFVDDAVSGMDREEFLRQLFGEKIDLKFTDLAKEALAARPVNKTFAASKSKEEVIKELLNEAHCVYIQTGSENLNEKDTIWIKAIQEIRGGTAKKQFVLYRPFNQTQNVYPILKFDAPLNMLMLPGVGLFTHKAKILDSSTKKSTEVDKGAAYAQDRSPRVSSADGTMAGGPQETGKTYPTPDRGADGSLGDMISHATQSMFDQVFTYDVTTAGVFDLKPGDPIDIKVSDIDFLSGSFDVFEVEHSVSADSGAETRFKAARTGGAIGHVSKGIESAKNKLIESSSSGKKIKSTDAPLIKDDR